MDRKRDKGAANKVNGRNENVIRSRFESKKTTWVTNERKQAKEVESSKKNTIN